MNRVLFGLVCVTCGAFLILSQPWQMPPRHGLSMIGFVFAILGLAWLALRRAYQQQQHFKEILKTEPPGNMEHTRRLASIAILLVGGIFVFRSPSLPHGYIMVLFAILGFLGYNVFRGGPLDRRRGRNSVEDEF